MSKGNVVVCVLPEKSYISVIERAKNFAQRGEDVLKVVTIQPKNSSAQKRASELKTLYDISKSANVNIDVIYSDDFISGIKSYIKKNDISCLYIENSDVLINSYDVIGNIAINK